MMKRIFYFILITLCFSCENDDSFNSGMGFRLEFSTDTLSLDTLFSKTPSSTYGFWVHNRHDDGIRLSSVRLKRGNQTGYRVNVDGVYLDNCNGSQTNQVEIHRNDSILVFVELTAQENGQESPVLVEDDLLFTAESGLEQKVNLRAWSWDAIKLYNPKIERDSVIESSKPLVIYGDFIVPENVTLFLRNTTLYFHDASGLEVKGRLNVEHCMMRGDRLDRMFDYLPYDRVSGQWDGLHFYPTSTGNILSDTEIRNTVEGIVCDSADIDDSQYRLYMQSCIIHNNVGNGIYTKNARILLDHCQLSNVGGDCLSVVGGAVTVNNCTLAQFYPFSARGAALRFTNYSGDSILPLNFICTGSILTGYEDDVVMGEISEKGDCIYNFTNCLLRTPAVSESSNFTNIIWESSGNEIQGKDHFVKVDEENLSYDFHLVEKSPAQGLGCY